MTGWFSRGLSALLLGLALGLPGGSPAAAATGPAAPLRLVAPQARPPAWSATGPLLTGRQRHTATRLRDGRVLVVGGEGSTGVLASAELYDPAAGAWSATASMLEVRHWHTATLLPDGTVLAAGGMGPGGVLAFTERYDPATGTWRSAGDMAVPRLGHSAVLLPSGQVLVIGGWSEQPPRAVADAELYDPATDRWTRTGSLLTARAWPAATLLPDGTVLVAGGGENQYVPHASAELYEPATGTWRATGAMHTARAFHPAVLLADGSVLVAGGNGPSGYLSSAEVYAPATGRWSRVSSMASPRGLYQLVALPAGPALAIGGYRGGDPRLASVERFDPATGAWSADSSLITSRSFHTATLLADGSVLVAGGQGEVSPGRGLTSAERYGELAPGAPPPTSDCRRFEATGQAACGPFRRYWEARGGLTQFGYPISPPLQERNPDDGQEYTVQYFERARFEYHPEHQGTPHEVQLGLLGRAVTRGREGEPPFQPIADPGDGRWVAATGHSLRFSFRAHWEATGGLAVYGYPISEEFQERNPDDGQTYTVQYFERARFEYHPEHQGTPHEVQLGLLGRQVFGRR